MAAPISTPLPPAPSRSEGEAVFVPKANAFLGALEPFRVDLQAQADFVESAAAAADSSAIAAADEAEKSRLSAVQANKNVANSGYQFIGDYAASIVLTEYNQVLRDSSGEFWRAAGTTPLPYTTTGSGVDEGGALSSVGDAVLRQGLASSVGASMVGYGLSDAKTALDESLSGAKLSRDFSSNYNPIFNTNGVKYFAHRGLSQLNPENTIPAFEMAGEIGMYGVECDLHPTADGHFVILHDLTLERTTDSTGDVTTMTLDNIRLAKINLGANLNANRRDYVNLFPNLQIPTLEEFILSCQKYGTIGLIEVKLYTPELRVAFYEVLKKHNFTSRCILMQSDETSLAHYRSMDGSIALAYLKNISPEAISFAAGLGSCMISCNHETAGNFTKENIQLCHAADVKVSAWVVNRARDAKKLGDLGVDFITTDILSGGFR